LNNTIFCDVTSYAVLVYTGVLGGQVASKVGKFLTGYLNYLSEEKETSQTGLQELQISQFM